MLPCFDEDEMLKLIAKFCSIEKRFISSAKGYSLYLRPMLIGTNGGLGVAAPTEALFLLVGSPVGAYHAQDLSKISIETVSSSTAVRAWPGGPGNKKVGANYAPCLVHEITARQRGYKHVLWLFGAAGHLTEVGTMNIFIVFRREDASGYELATPRLRGTILPGITRDSVLSLAREKLQPTRWSINERDIPMEEVAAASEKGLLAEIFGTGTAAVVTPIRSIN
ncbi:hypothetical protein P3342_007574 [Pyrenophora teres f. teres]|uniref:Branched-chain-amino-acid aminotransferase n=1 Tax=Pyrenophora teres f. teres TaxID=97479 RepID=A0A6S6W1P4_9PLEO|nr:hypothetical protein HRS9139_10462 [Pyrenophora teres f. teres]KAE8822191.1 hypothetical protein PTNB85_10494 [Pyrenophora teres f. teres]KAE8823678.1 hypothetical protein HRS9122_10459 [Pyrenophora teres f. teres]KAE8852445.1 hypothetical protein PTNB29_10466 [Pyrenophora teres f. teres]KAE8854660.1 hypothetical protein PTNB73_10463 [Pyrenophora teres f. teres]